MSLFNVIEYCGINDSSSFISRFDMIILFDTGKSKSSKVMVSPSFRSYPISGLLAMNMLSIVGS